jgi:hypothetical protein
MVFLHQLAMGSDHGLRIDNRAALALRCRIQREAHRRANRAVHRSSAVYMLASLASATMKPKE